MRMLYSLVLLLLGVINAFERGSPRIFTEFPKYWNPDAILELETGFLAVTNLFSGTEWPESTAHITGEGQIALVNQDSGSISGFIDLPGAGMIGSALARNPVSNEIFYCDVSNSILWKVDLERNVGSMEHCFDLPGAHDSERGTFCSDITFDKDGYVYVSDSVNNYILRTSKDCTSPPMFWLSDELLTPRGINTIGPTGITFDHDEQFFYVAVSGSAAIIRIPVSRTHDNTLRPYGSAELFAYGIVLADNIYIDVDGNIWVSSHTHELQVLSPDGTIIGRVCDFGGIDSEGRPDGCLGVSDFLIRDDDILISNMAGAYNRFAGLPFHMNDWTEAVSVNTITKVLRTSFRLEIDPIRRNPNGEIDDPPVQDCGCFGDRCHNIKMKEVCLLAQAIECTWLGECEEQVCCEGNSGCATFNNADLCLESSCSWICPHGNDLHSETFSTNSDPEGENGSEYDAIDNNPAGGEDRAGKGDGQDETLDPNWAVGAQGPDDNQNDAEYTEVSPDIKDPEFREESPSATQHAAGPGDLNGIAGNAP